MNVRKMTNSMLKQKAEAFGTVLYSCAKKQPKRKFHALYDKVYRPDILKHAWIKVKSNQGSAGVDKISIDYIMNEYGESRFLNELYTKLKNNMYQPKPVRRVYIPKGNTKDLRPLGIPTLEDRVVQQATKLVIEPIFEADFKDVSYGFRPGRNQHMAMKRIRSASNRNYYVVDIDIKGFFDNINHDKLMQLIALRISDNRILKLIRSWLKSGILENGVYKETLQGSPQGGVISPLLSNVYLNYLDTIWETHCSEYGTLVRYADDMVVLCKNKKNAKASMSLLKQILKRLDLEINKEKSKLVNIWDDSEGFDFLGFHNRRFPRRNKNGRVFYNLQHVPSKKAMKSMKATFKEYISPRSKLILKTDQLIKGLNRKIVGMRNYYYISAISQKWLAKIDWYVRELLIIHNNKRRNKRRKRANRLDMIRLCDTLGLKKLAIK